MSKTNVVAIDTCKSSSPSKRYARKTDSEIMECIIYAAGGITEKYTAGEEISSEIDNVIDRLVRIRNMNGVREIAVPQELTKVAIPNASKPMNNRLTPESTDAKILDYLLSQKYDDGNFIACGRSVIISGIGYTKNPQDITNRLRYLVADGKIEMSGKRKGAKYYPSTDA
jgi:hypothetical protein